MNLTVDHLLADACPSSEHVNEHGELVLTTTVTLHCFKYEIEYIKLVEGEYNNNAMNWNVPPLFHILKWTRTIA